MKKIRKILGIFMCFLIAFLSITSIVNAFNSRQIVKFGGEQNKNTAGVEDGVKVSKVISATDTENFFDITLTVDTEYEIKEIMRDQDLAIVVVMDVSNTMIQNNVDGTTNSYGEEIKDANGKGTGTFYPDYVAGKAGDITRYATAITAGDNFIDEFVKYSTGTQDDTVRQVGFVAFNTNAKKIVDLQTVKTTAQGTSFKTTMKNKTEEIVESAGYNVSHDRFTNIEAGIKMAHDMLESAGDVDNKIIIFLSDGIPTTYISSGYNGYDPYDSTSTTSTTGRFYNEIYGKSCNYGTSYSNRGAIRARKAAIAAKDSGIEIFSVGTGIEKQTTVPEYMEKDSTKSFAVVDTDNVSSFEIGNTRDDFKLWLKNQIGSGDEHYFDASNKTSLENAYVNIFKQIKDSIEVASKASWVAEDPMGATEEEVKNIEFVGLYDDLNVLQESITNYKGTEQYNEIPQSDTASFADNKISWDLKISSYTTTTEGTKTIFHYSIKYRVRLKNELDSFIEGTEYKTNGYTKLTYVTRTDGVLSGDKYIKFPEPSVKGYLGEFEFIKKSDYGNRVFSGVKFNLVHSPDCTCHNGYIANMENKSVNVNTSSAISDATGKVVFTNIPSGHQYILKEDDSTVPHDHIKVEDSIINVAFGEVTGNPDGNILVNTIKRGNLEIKKKVEGNDNYSGVFDFELDLFFNGEYLQGELYEYIILDSNGNQVSKGTNSYNTKVIISLRDEETYIIKNLPVGVTYSLKETNTNGYQVEYQVNNNDVQTGEEAICNSNTGCRIEEGNNSVLFINIAGYILPATGSSGMLIMIIIASLLMLWPIIDIGCNLYRNRKEDKLTS